MKTKNILIAFVFLLIGTNIQAQILDKIAKRAESTAERTVLNRTDREVSKQTNKTIDGVIEGDKEKNTKKTPKKSKTKKKTRNPNIIGGNMDGIPDSYNFQYSLDMKITSDGNTSNLKYFAAPNASYFGTGVAGQNKSVIVYDIENQAMITFMNSNGQKMAMKMNMPLQEEMQEMINQKGSNSKGDGMKYIPIEGKTLLGYKCKGYLVKQEEGTSKIYITNEAPIGFLGMLASVNAIGDDKNTIDIPFDENSTIMEMEFTSNSKNRDDMHILCTAIEKHQFTINRNEYRGL